jgi:hypothetical protein
MDAGRPVKDDKMEKAVVDKVNEYRTTTAIVGASVDLVMLTRERERERESLRFRNESQNDNVSCHAIHTTYCQYLFSERLVRFGILEQPITCRRAGHDDNDKMAQIL